MQEQRLKEELYARLRSDSAIFEFLQQGSLDGVWYRDLELPGQVWMSARYWEAFGVDPEKNPPSIDEWQSMVHPDDLANARQAFSAHLADASVPYDCVIRYRHTGGHWVWVRSRGIALRDADGVPRRMLGAHTDITALKERELELSAALERVELLNAALHEFAAVASHDLRSPMTAIAQLAEILIADAGPSLNARQAGMLEHIRARSTMLATLLSSMLDYLRVHESSTEHALQAVDLAGVVQDAMEIYRRGVDRLTIDGHAVAFVVPAHVHTIFRNLVANAIRHHHGPEAHIRVTLSESYDGVEVRFEDDGPGISPEHRESVFQLFKTLHPKDPESGVGLGLAMVRQLVLRARGTIEIVDPQHGSGASFCIRLPAARDA